MTFIVYFVTIIAKQERQKRGNKNAPDKSHESLVSMVVDNSDRGVVVKDVELSIVIVIVDGTFELTIKKCWKTWM